MIYFESKVMDNTKNNLENLNSYPLTLRCIIFYLKLKFLLDILFLLSQPSNLEALIIVVFTPLLPLSNIFRQRRLEDCSKHVTTLACWRGFFSNNLWCYVSFVSFFLPLMHFLLCLGWLWILFFKIQSSL